MTRKSGVVFGVGLAAGLGLGAYAGGELSDMALDVPRSRAEVAACAGRLGVGETSYLASELPSECEGSKGIFDITIITSIQRGLTTGEPDIRETNKVLSVPSRKIFENRAEKTLASHDDERIIRTATTIWGGLLGLSFSFIFDALRRRNPSK
jgi:hypothetical protein